MATTLKIYLVNMADDLGGSFSAGHRKTCGEKLKARFDAIIRGVGKYSEVAVTWDGKSNDPTDFDFVCYVLTSHSSSIAIGKAPEGSQLGASGSTVYSVKDKAVVSEVYLRQIVQGGIRDGGATAEREKMVAHCILHELAHNLLDATTPEVLDVHKVKDGVICRDWTSKPLQTSEAPSEADNVAFRTGFGRRSKGIKQYTAHMPAPPPPKTP